MGTLNRVDIIGRLGRDPEMRYAQSGLAVTNISVATDRRRKDGESTTDWHRVVCFGKTAEAVNDHVGKGDQILVTGTLTYDSYQTEDGQTRHTTEIQAHRVLFLGSRNGVHNGDAEQEPGPQAAPVAAEPVASPF